MKVLRLKVEESPSLFEQAATPLLTSIIERGQ
jgi:hypothetical protein